MKRRLHTVLMTLTMCMAMSASVFAAGSNFKDVPSDHWAYTYIERAYSDGAVGGSYHDPITGVRLYAPDDTLTKAQFVTILTNAFYSSEVENSTASGAWYAKNEDVARAHGLLVSVTGSMDEVVSRFDMAVLLSNTLRDKGIVMPTADQRMEAMDKIADWNDVPVEYQNQVCDVYYLGIIGGIDAKGTFAGKNNMNRAQAAVVYSHVADTISGASMPPAQEEKKELRLGSDPDLVGINELLLSLVNQARAEEGLNPLTLHSGMADAAQLRANELLESYSHTRPNGSEYYTVLKEAGIDYAPGGENIAAGYTSVEAVFDGWMNSPGHRANILRKGIGTCGFGYAWKNNDRYEHYWAQLFGP